MRLAAFVFAATALLIAPLSAQETATPTGQVTGTHPANAPSSQLTMSKCKGATNVASDAFEGNFQTKVGIYSGNVIVTQDDCKLRSDKVVAAATTGKDIDRLTANGNVVFDSSSGTATGDNGIYDLTAKTITLTGKVILTKGKDVMRGTLLVVNLNTGLAHLTAKGMAGGRVQSTLVPADKTQSESKKPPKPKADVSN